MANTVTNAGSKGVGPYGPLGPTYPGQAKREDLKRGALVRAVYTHLPEPQSERVMRVLRKPRRQKLTEGYEPWWVTVTDVDGPAAGIRYDLSLSDFNFQPYPNGRWNGTNFLVLVKAAS